jgi:hypothetical protein
MKKDAKKKEFILEDMSEDETTGGESITNKDAKERKLEGAKSAGLCCFTTSILCFLSFMSLFFYLVGMHYPFEGWMKGEKIAFITIFVLGGVATLYAIGIFLDYQSISRTISTDNGGLVDPKLIELNEILYTDKVFNYSELKHEVLKLKSNELEPQLRTSQIRLTKLITGLKNRVTNDVRAIIDLYLQAHALMITQEKENDTFAQSQLTNFEDALQNHLTQEELRTLLVEQKDTLALEKHLNNLNNLLGITRYDIDRKGKEKYNVKDEMQYDKPSLSELV